LDKVLSSKQAHKNKARWKKEETLERRKRARGRGEVKRYANHAKCINMP